MPSPDLQDLHLAVVQHLLLLKVIRYVLLMICEHADIDRVLQHTVDIRLRNDDLIRFKKTCNAAEDRGKQGCLFLSRFLLLIGCVRFDIADG